MSSYGDFIEKAERDVLTYFKYCPLCFAENSMEFHWSFKDDALSCSKCGAKWHINHGLAGFRWAKLIKINAEEKGTELLGKKIDPLFWKQMALNGVRLAEQAGGQGAEEPKEPEPQEPLTKGAEKQAAEQTRAETSESARGEKERWWWNPLKYFLHGISFSLLLGVLTIFWAFILALLLRLPGLLGLFIQLIIGVVVLFSLMGGLNVFLSDIIWGVSARTSWTSLLGHGLLLFILLLVVSVPALLINISSPNLAITIALSIVYAFIDGFIAKNVAEYFEEEYEEID